MQFPHASNTFMDDISEYGGSTHSRSQDPVSKMHMYCTFVCSSYMYTGFERSSFVIKFTDTDCYDHNSLTSGIGGRLTKRVHNEVPSSKEEKGDHMYNLMDTMYLPPPFLMYIFSLKRKFH